MAIALAPLNGFIYCRYAYEGQKYGRSGQGIGFYSERGLPGVFNLGSLRLSALNSHYILLHRARFHLGIDALNGMILITALNDKMCLLETLRWIRGLRLVFPFACGTARSLFQLCNYLLVVNKAAHNASPSSIDR